MKCFNLFFCCLVAAFLLPNVNFAQASCQPKDCKKEATAEKSKTNDAYYVKVDLKETPKPTSCAPKSPKAVKAAAKANSGKVNCKPNCDPKDCPPECQPANCAEEKASTAEAKNEAKAKTVSLKAKKDCDPEDCLPNCCKEEKGVKKSSL